MCKMFKFVTKLNQLSLDTNKESEIAKRRYVELAKAIEQWEGVIWDRYCEVSLSSWLDSVPIA